MTIAPECGMNPDLTRWDLCALYAGKLAQAEGKLHDSEHVKRLAYELYEEGAFGEPEKPPER
jgi:hypothetical protein